MKIATNVRRGVWALLSHRDWVLCISKMKQSLSKLIIDIGQLDHGEASTPTKRGK